MISSINPANMSAYQQQWAKEYETLKQIREANKAVVAEFKKMSGLTPAETKAFDQAKFNYLEAERQMIGFVENRNTGIDNAIKLADHQLAHAGDLQLNAFEIDQKTRLKAELYTQKLDLALLKPKLDWVDIDLHEEQIGVTVYNNNGVLRANPLDLADKIIYGMKEWASNVAEATSWYVSLPDTLLDSGQKYGLCNFLTGLMGGFAGSKILSGLGLPTPWSPLKPSTWATTPGEVPAQMLSDINRAAFKWEFKAEGTGACKVYAPKSSLLDFGLLSDAQINDLLTLPDYFAISIPADVMNQVIAEQATADMAVKMFTQNNDIGTLQLAALADTYSGTQTDFVSDPAASWNGFAQNRVETQATISGQLTGLNGWLEGVLGADQNAFRGMWQSDAENLAGAAGPATNLFSVTTNPSLAPSQTGATDPVQSVSANNSTLINTGTCQVNGLGNVNEATGNYAYANDLLTGGYRPGNQNLATEILGSQLAANFLANPNLANSVVWNPEVQAAARISAALTPKAFAIREIATVLIDEQPFINDFALTGTTSPEHAPGKAEKNHLPGGSDFSLRAKLAHGRIKRMRNRADIAQGNVALSAFHRPAVTAVKLRQKSHLLLRNPQRFTACANGTSQFLFRQQSFGHARQGKDMATIDPRPLLPNSRFARYDHRIGTIGSFR